MFGLTNRQLANVTVIILIIIIITYFTAVDKSGGGGLAIIGYFVIFAVLTAPFGIAAGITFSMLSS
jgi:hypothetical protein